MSITISDSIAAATALVQTTTQTISADAGAACGPFGSSATAAAMSPSPLGANATNAALGTKCEIPSSVRDVTNTYL